MVAVREELESLLLDKNPEKLTVVVHNRMQGSRSRFQGE